MTVPRICRTTGKSTDKCDCFRCRPPGANMDTIQLTVEHRTGRDGKPYMLIEGLPRLGAELDPEQAQALGRQLIQAAIDSRQGERGTRQYPAED